MSLEQNTIALHDATGAEVALFAFATVILGIVSGIALSWLVKWTYRGLGFDKLPNVAIMWITILIGAASGFAVHWMIGDFVSALINYNLNSEKARIFAVVFSAIGTPFIYNLVMGWLWDTKRFRMFKKLRVAHRQDVDYTDPDFSEDTETRYSDEDRTESRDNG